MNPDTERMVKAYLDVYFRFHQIYYDELYNIDEVDSTEAAILFQAALQDSILGELLKQEMMNRFMELKEEETKQPATEVVQE